MVVTDIFSNKRKYLMSCSYYSWCVCVCACVCVPADYPPPPPPVEDSAGFPSSSSSFPPPPMNSYDYQVSVFTSPRLSVTLWKWALTATRQPWALHWVHAPSPATLSVHLSCSQLQRRPTSDAAWSQPPKLKDLHTRHTFSKSTGSNAGWIEDWHLLV